MHTRADVGRRVTRSSGLEGDCANSELALGSLTIDVALLLRPPRPTSARRNTRRVRAAADRVAGPAEHHAQLESRGAELGLRRGLGGRHVGGA